MNMKRSLILSLCAVVVAAIGMSTAQADVDVALNLRYTQPADPNQGGTWTLVAKGDSDGLVGLVTRFTDLAAAGTVDGSIGHDINGGALQVGTFSGETEFVYGQDPNGGLVHSVGLVGGPSDQGSDPLNNAAWDDASVIATGSFAALRPVFVSASGNVTDVSDAISAAVIGLTNVRGDSVTTDGLLPGDANRSGVVNSADLALLLANFNSTTGTWGQGNFNDTTSSDGNVNSADLALLLSNFNGSSTPPALAGVAGVPEPASVVLLLAGAGLGLVVRRRK
jgi:hypothetical protein